MIIIISFHQILLKNNEISLTESRFSSIELKINGSGIKNVFTNYSNYFTKQNYPNEIYINGEIQYTINSSYYFNQTENFVELIWNRSIDNCSGMFYQCSDITEIDLSNFDTSNVTDMNNMFYNCSLLSSLNLSNFNTSKVTNMAYTFYNCTLLSSLNLLNFNTSKVTNMNSMFYGCSK